MQQLDLFNQSKSKTKIKNQINMYQVKFYHNSELTKTFEFTTERKAITCLESDASHNSLQVTNGQWYASSGGNIPEQEIQIEKI